MTPSHSRLTVRPRALVAALLLSLVAPAVARAHVGAAPEPHDLWSAWNAEPVVMLGLAFAAWSYARGVRALRARAGRRGIAPWRTRCYAGGLLAVAVALLSPVDAVGAALFSAHMVQHLLLIMVAAPLLALGDPATATLWAMPIGARRAVGGAWKRARVARAAWRALRHPATAWSLHVLALWLWHLPRLYERALRDPAVHVIEHLSFFATALLFWWVLADRHSRRRLGSGAALLYLFAAALQSTALGAWMSFARHPWYRAHARSALAWGLNALEDQQLAGLIMWVPSSLVYLAAVAAIVVPMLALDRRPRADARLRAIDGTAH